MIIYASDLCVPYQGSRSSPVAPAGNQIHIPDLPAQARVVKGRVPNLFDKTQLKLNVSMWVGTVAAGPMLHGVLV